MTIGSNWRLRNKAADTISCRQPIRTVDVTFRRQLFQGGFPQAAATRRRGHAPYSDVISFVSSLDKNARSECADFDKRYQHHQTVQH
jgi:hypothetical protein